jgi:DNA-binding NarL/FixJ family response regulator
VLKSNSSDSIMESIKTVHQGNVVFEKDIARLLSDMMEKEDKLSWQDLNITERECMIMELISQGQSNKEIAETLFMSEGTIRNNISILLDKLELRDRTQLAIFYIRKLEK